MSEGVHWGGESAADVRLSLTTSRYSDRPFPAYRFVPGRNPHPTAHPEGHSFVPPGEPHVVVRWVAPEEWRKSGEYLFGCDLYNHGYWWEAHEAWEGLWQVCDKTGSQGLFLQGLIQVAACHLKLFIGHYDGVERLFASSMGYLDQVGPHVMHGTYMGLELDEFIGRVKSYYAEANSRQSRQLVHDAASYPHICLSA
jgi:hypothetical protein